MKTARSSLIRSLSFGRKARRKELCGTAGQSKTVFGTKKREHGAGEQKCAIGEQKGRLKVCLKKLESLSTRKNSEWQVMNYEEYHFGFLEWLRYSAQGIFLLALLVYVFYRNFLFFVFLLPLGFCYPFYIKGRLKKQRLARLQVQFKDAIQILASGLNAGYSVENALTSSLDELDRIYGPDSMISSEIRQMLRKIRMNHTMEEVMGDFAKRSGLEDIENFTEVFVAARKSGGELMKIISRTADIIGEKIRIQEEILTLTAAKRMEQKVMTTIPVFLVFYIEWTSPGFFGVLYETVTGRIIMTISLTVYMMAVWIGGKLLEIEV